MQQQFGALGGRGSLVDFEALHLGLVSCGLSNLGGSLVGGSTADLTRRSVLRGSGLFRLVCQRSPRFIGGEHVVDKTGLGTLANSAIAIRRVVTEPPEIDHAG